ncbi:hypothetical protein EV356DRAFT_530986 [Viridothelium virens]|uniref:Uncharacterized protein n=1 Tax=Viridothelium virens TaxID=1048519 RepID=A0A6A6HE07_VIRVR|nr:hypothetical protein EV356DRAFT_530986 [Viridothelium virens]
MSNPQQFSRAPKFSLNSSQRARNSPGSRQQPPAKTPVKPPPRFWSQTPAPVEDSIDDSSQDHDTTSPVTASISSPAFDRPDKKPQSASSSEEDEDVSPTTPHAPTKRRRLQSPSSPSHHQPSFLTPRPPSTPAAAATTSTGAGPAAEARLETPASLAKRYIIPTHTTTASASTVTPDSKSPAGYMQPVPEVFSPRRHGRKYIPGGMADTVAAWVVEAGESGTSPRRGRRSGMEAEGAGFVRVEESKGSEGGGQGGMICVRGQVVGRKGGERVELLLAGGGGSRGREVRVGEIIEVRPPTWEVVLDGRAWQVVADWRVR